VSIIYSVSFFIFQDCFGLVYGVQQYFNYIVAVSFIGGGNWSTQRKPLTCHKSLTNSVYGILVLLSLETVNLKRD
jgi:hypothetical protein